jgi:hypothetical protein
MGDDKFKRIIEDKIGVRLNRHGGDRKSLTFLGDQVLHPLDWNDVLCAL